ncbi:Gfo/Idh/MocA family protein [Lysobacter korlensis]|uniref:Gfo/Idh/MocA family protein n=1 Tax=Lysobacter korlensis TaxID=553636 RepID=A0ABV6RW41_9GAMM
MRFGLVGTGYWASTVHGPGLLRTPQAELVGVAGRNAGKRKELARRLGVTPFEDPAELFARVDAVAFAVPPDVQAPLAVRAANLGKHLLLEKPVATTASQAAQIAAAVAASRAASVVFLTDRYAPEIRKWFDRLRLDGGWRGGWVRGLGSLDSPGNPYGDSVWRRERGALWDIGPHALSNLTAALGPIDHLSAIAGEGDLTHLVITHISGATSTVTISQFAPAAAGTRNETCVWGTAGILEKPLRTTSDADTLAIAAAELIEAAETGAKHPIDAAFGAHLVDLLESADRQRSVSRPGTQARHA